MNGAFDVSTIPHFDRLLKRLASGHPREAPDVFAEALAILQVDPYNRSRRHSIKKLESIRSGEGQYRLRLGRWRFRYDILAHTVVLTYCGLRREDTY